jgi:hypothetical protein
MLSYHLLSGIGEADHAIRLYSPACTVPCIRKAAPLSILGFAHLALNILAIQAGGDACMPRPPGNQHRYG